MAPVVDWGAWTIWNRFPKDPIVYQHDIIDVGAVLQFTPLVTVTGQGTPTIDISYSSDGVSYTNFTAVTSQIEARYFIVRVTMTDPVIAEIENVIIIADAQALVEDQSDIDMSTLTGSTGDRRVTLIKDFAVITSVMVALQNVGAGYTWELIDKSVVSGPRFKVYDDTLTLVDVASIDIVIRGIAA